MSASFNTYLYLLDSNGNQIAYDYDHSSSSGDHYSRINQTLPLNGTYVIEATTYYGWVEGLYTLKSNALMPLTTPNETVHVTNSAFTSSSPISTRRSNCYAHRFTFTGTQGQQVRIEMSAPFNTYLYLLDSSGNQIAYDYDHSSSSGGYYSRINIYLPQTGTYTIEATEYQNATGSYRLENNVSLQSVSNSPKIAENPSDPVQITSVSASPKTLS